MRAVDIIPIEQLLLRNIHVYLFISHILRERRKPMLPKEKNTLANSVEKHWEVWEKFLYQHHNKWLLRVGQPRVDMCYTTVKIMKNKITVTGKALLTYV